MLFVPGKIIATATWELRRAVAKFQYITSLTLQWVARLTQPEPFEGSHQFTCCATEITTSPFHPTAQIIHIKLQKTTPHNYHLKLARSWFPCLKIHHSFLHCFPPPTHTHNCPCAYLLDNWHKHTCCCTPSIANTCSCDLPRMPATWAGTARTTTDTTIGTNECRLWWWWYGVQRDRPTGEKGRWLSGARSDRTVPTGRGSLLLL